MSYNQYWSPCHRRYTRWFDEYFLVYLFKILKFLGFVVVAAVLNTLFSPASAKVQKCTAARNCFKGARWHVRYYHMTALVCPVLSRVLRLLVLSAGGQGGRDEGILDL